MLLALIIALNTIGTKDVIVVPPIDYLGEISSLSISPDGKFIVSGGEDGIKIWNMKEGMLASTIMEVGYILSLDVSPDGEFFVSGDENGSINIWNIEDGTLMEMIFSPYGHVWNLAISPDGKFIISTN